MIVNRLKIAGLLALTMAAVAVASGYWMQNQRAQAIDFDFEVRVDCDVSTTAIDPACNFPPGPTTYAVDVVITNTTGGPINLAAFNFNLNNDNQPFLNPAAPSCLPPGTACNPDFNEGVGGVAWSCAPPNPAPDLEPTDTQKSISFISCSNASDAFNAPLADGQSKALARVNFGVTGTGTSNLALEIVNVFDDLGSEVLGCGLGGPAPQPGDSGDCAGATVTIGAAPATSTNTPLSTSTNTPLPTSTNTPLPTSTNTPLPTSTNTPLPTSTNTPLPTSTNTPGPTATNTPIPTSTNTPLPTSTNTAGPTATDTAIPTETNTPLPTATDTNTPVPTSTNTPEPTATETQVPTATNTLEPGVDTPTPEPTATATEVPPTATATNTPEPTATNTTTPADTNTPEPTATNTSVPTATNTSTAPTATSTNTPGATKTAAVTRTVVATRTVGATRTVVVTRTVEPTTTPGPGFCWSLHRKFETLIHVLKRLGSHEGERRYKAEFDLDHDGDIDWRDVEIIFVDIPTCRSPRHHH